MTENSYRRSVPLAATPDEAFAWHVRPGALRRLLPPFENVRIESGSGPEERLRAGARTVLSVGLGPVRKRWTAEVVECDAEDRVFVDEQRGGPFRSWRHRHTVEARSDERSELVDDVRYALPLGALGGLVAGRMVRKKLERMFAWRHRILVHDLARHAQAREADFQQRTIAITGASGLVGGTLAAFLRTGGHRVLELVRREARAPHEVSWDPSGGDVDTARLEGIDGLVHLAGESIFGLRWTEDKKRRIAQSRIEGTRTIARAVSRMQRPPRVCVFASAIGFYGARGDEVLTEESARGTGFLADTCVQWEDEAVKVPGTVREVRTRLGVVLDPAGGALATMLPAFRAGVAGPLGSGDQWFPWVALDDVLGVMHRALWDESLSGPVNLVAPEGVTNRTFTRTLGSVLRRPTILPAPGFALKAAIGAEQAEEMLLSSTRVEPAALVRAGYAFGHPTLRGALAHCLGKQI